MWFHGLSSCSCIEEGGLRSLLWFYSFISYLIMFLIALGSSITIAMTASFCTTKAISFTYEIFKRKHLYLELDVFEHNLSILPRIFIESSSGMISCVCFVHITKMFGFRSCSVSIHVLSQAVSIKWSHLSLPPHMTYIYIVLIHFIIIFF